MSLKINTDKQLEKYIEDKAELFDSIKNKQYVTDSLASFEDEGLPNPFEVVRDFIKEKGLKLYGGQALHEHLKKRKKPIYDKYEFPDYDVFSPDAWNHAKELCDRLYNMGFFFVEAKASIVNDQKHQTYKVSVDLIYVLDLTQIGCDADKLEIGDCKSCGMYLNKQCFSFFNNIPALDILSSSDEEYRESYDYKTKTGLYKKKLLVCSPNWLKISMYLEMTQPYNDPSRLKKVYNRLNLFESEFEYNLCKTPESFFYEDKDGFYNKKFVKDILIYVENYISKSKILHYGSTAYNFYVNNTTFPLEPVYNYEVYTTEDPDAFYLELIEELKTKFSKKSCKFKLSPRIMYWKDIDSDNYDILFSVDNSNYKHLITFTRSYECMPYVQYNNTRYASFDRIKYNYYRGAVLPDIISMSEYIPRNYKCLLNNLLVIEKKLKKEKKTLILNGKYEPFKKDCIGGDVNKLIGNLYDNFGNNIRLSKKTKMYIDTPKKDFITKIYPAEKDTKMKLYRPAEKKTKYYNKLLKFQDKRNIDALKKHELGRPLYGNFVLPQKSKPKHVKSYTKSNKTLNKKSNKKSKFNKRASRQSKKKLSNKQKNIIISNQLI